MLIYVNICSYMYNIPCITAASGNQRWQWTCPTSSWWSPRFTSWLRHIEAVDDSQIFHGAGILCIIMYNPFLLPKEWPSHATHKYHMIPPLFSGKQLAAPISKSFQSKVRGHSVVQHAFHSLNTLATKRSRSACQWEGIAWSRVFLMMEEANSANSHRTTEPVILIPNKR